MRLLLVLLLLPLAESSQRSYDVSGQSHFTETSYHRYQRKMAKLNTLQQEIMGVKVTQSSPESDAPALWEAEQKNPERNPYLFEGDIVLTDEQMDIILKNTEDQLWASKSGKNRDRRSLTSQLSQRWTGAIPYYINTGTGVDEQAVLAGINQWQKDTCVQFTRLSQPPSGNGLVFVRGTGCSSYIGKTSFGPQSVSIGYGCELIGIVCHEIGHALGFFHEQGRYDRDDYVTVNAQNIQPYYLNQFTKQLKSQMVDYGVGYDYGSIMHYDQTAFSSNGGVTIVTKDGNYQNTIGYRGPPAFADVKKINFAYCNGTCSVELACQNSGYTDPKDCTKCRCPDGFGGTLCDRAATNTARCGSGDLTTTDDYQNITISGTGTCYYVIKAPTGRKVAFQITESYFYNAFPCQDFAEIKYKADPALAGARFCGVNHPTTSSSEKNQLVVIYNGFPSSRLNLIYKHIPPVGSETSTTSTTTTTTTLRTTTTTRAPATTTTRRTVRTTRWTRPTTTLPRWVTFFPPASKVCTDWSFCSSSCGGCGRQSRTCTNGVESQACNFSPCGFNSCCSPYVFDTFRRMCVTRK